MDESWKCPSCGHINRIDSWSISKKQSWAQERARSVCEKCGRDTRLTAFSEMVNPLVAKRGYAIAALVLGIINLFAMYIPICGVPLAIAGVVLGILGLKSSLRTMAIVGIVLSGIGLLLVFINDVVGIYQGLTHPNF